MANIQPPPIETYARANANSGFSAGTWSICTGILGLAGWSCLLGLILGPLGIAIGLAGLGKPFESKVRLGAGIVVSTLALLASVAAMFSGLASIGPFSMSDIKEWVGVQSPDFSLTTSDNKTLRLSDYRGKVVLVDVWATWCPPCRDSIPHLEALHREGVVVLGLSTDSAETLLSFLKEEPISYPNGVIDETFPEPFSAVHALPTLFVIDRNGVIVAVEIGYKSLEEFRMLSQIRDHAGPLKNPPNAQTNESF